MKNIFKLLFGSDSPTPPENILTSFKKHCGESLNTEWISGDNFYEAIYYKDETEHIARFGKNGDLINMKKNIPIQFTPEHIKKKAGEHGELMNTIVIMEGDRTEYELIVRDEELIRYTLLLTDDGKEISKVKL